MTVSDISADIISHLDTNWNTGVTVKPEIIDGYRAMNPKGNPLKYSRSVKVFDAGTKFDYVNPARDLRDEEYNASIEILSTSGNVDRNNILSECERILHNTGMTGYNNRFIISSKKKDDSVSFITELGFQTFKYSQSI